MAKCLHSHQSCNVSSSTRMPTRLIFLGDTYIKLCLSSELDSTPKYATLSHCWGSLPFMTLTTTNYEAFQHSIPLENIPKTFLDAMFVARELGFRYLWVDSLCIVQDDSDDWTAESSLMSDVYGNSTINIAASSAINGSVGLFFNRDPTWKCYIQTMGSGDPRWDCVPGTFNTILQDSPLSTRGWALQERVLPRRTLHFTSREVFWECDELVACETFPDGIPSAAPFYELQKRPMDREMWIGLVERYSRCKLTHLSDKLIAISGLARIAQSEINDEYVAGMWKNDLELQLGWYAPTTGTRPSQYVAPTWSWASIDGAVKLAGLDL
ncbi:HET-domain-containing protein, partial [Acephala macrosclerotiorum]